MMFRPITLTRYEQPLRLLIIFTENALFLVERRIKKSARVIFFSSANTYILFEMCHGEK